MKPPVLSDVVKGIRDLPSPAPVVMELIRSFEQEDISTHAVADKVSRDQALAAKTLRIANSSFYGLQRKVTTIPQAITVLGFDSVRTLIVSAGVLDAFAKNRNDAFDISAFWRHSIGTALCSKFLARALNLNQDQAFISGLLHDIGRLVLATCFAEHYAQVIAYRNTHDCFTQDAERAVLGFEHGMVGKTLSEHWKFPPLVQRAISDHHQPLTQDLGGITSVVHVADAIVHGLDLGGDEHDLVPPLSDAVWKSLQVAPGMLAVVFRETENEFEGACRVLGA